MPIRDVTRTYLELASPDELRDAPPPEAEERLRIRRLEPCPVERYRFLYREVGRDWHWVDRLEWTDARVEAHLARPGVEVWLLEADGETAGWFELVRHGDGSTEIAYFGLLPAFQGRGLGRWLLTEAVRRAFGGAARRVWLHTCTLDHPAALPNYLARGFRVFREERYRAEV